MDTLIKLGFHIKREKCILQVSQHFFFLGYMYQGAVQGHLSPRVTVKKIQRLMGCVISSKPAVPLTRARSRGIQEKDYKGTVSSAKKQVCLTSWAREEVNWWLNLTIEDFHMSLRIVPV